MKYQRWILALLLAGVAAAPATRPAARPVTAIDPASCVTSECHSKIKAFKVVHGPAASNACDACHELTSAADHTFKASREDADLCTYCHDFTVAGMPVVHKPVADGQCLGCHDPHGSDTHAIIREASTAELCARCHGATTEGKKVLHSPVAQGECDSCHPPHAAKFPKLLDVVGTDLCLACHQDIEPRLAAAKFRHKAMNDGCQKCHDPHGSANPLALAKPTTALCLDCHEKTKDQIAQATVAHSPVTDGRSCINCHTPHAGNVARLMSDVPAVACLRCHEKEIKYNGTTVSPVKEIADASAHKHGELKDGQCGGCHTVHGGANPGLLQRVYSAAFYQKFSAGNFELCFSCHDVKLVEEATTTATGFRNGTDNLHFVHANQGTRDKNCRSCHDMHAGKNTRLVRQTLPYGVWKMPMRFVGSETGGSCFPGCHREYAYDRVNPLPPTTRPATRPVEPIARSAHEDEQIVQWTTADEQGRTIAVPDQKRPAVLLFLQSGGGADEAAETVRDLRPFLPSDASTQVLVILVGKTEPLSLATLKETMPADWSLVLDPSNESADVVGVRGRPLALVLRPDGTQVVRLAASAPVLAIKLAPYIDLAAGRIDSVDPRVHAATQPVIDDPAKRLARELRVVDQLLAANQPQQALGVLQQLDARDRATPDAGCAQARALIQLNRAAEAVRVLDSIGKGRAPTSQEVIVRARAWIALREWRMAQTVMEDHLALLADSAAGHDLLGEIYEHRELWKQAAEQYRLASEIRKREPR